MFFVNTRKEISDKRHLVKIIEKCTTNIYLVFHIDWDEEKSCLRRGRRSVTMLWWWECLVSSSWSLRMNSHQRGCTTRFDKLLFSEISFIPALFSGRPDVHRSENSDIYLHCGATSPHCCLSHARNTGEHHPC